ncbi:phage head closure protein [uncultured Clostridium sp.]|uniref:phage head closure protein n=1 Tax=uncultured Clostridium sp. TaxID=59620 RepID=UPI0025F3F0CA|nr:phage head closure protein [uncultured Clostridium sp.]
MDIALLNTRIMVQKNELVVDDIGNHTNTWTDWYSCYATISSESPSEETDAGMVVDNTKLDFTIRWCKNAAEMTADKHRVAYAGEIYNILGIDHMNLKKKCIKLKCQKVRR